MFDFNDDGAIDAAVDYTLANRGGTFRADDLSPVTPDTGYAVAVSHLGTGNGSLLSPGQLRDRLVLDALGHFSRVPYIGTWIERTGWGNDVCYIDRVVIVPDRESALIVGRAFGERAIWDFAAGESVSTGLFDGLFDEDEEIA